MNSKLLNLFYVISFISCGYIPVNEQTLFDYKDHGDNWADKYKP